MNYLKGKIDPHSLLESLRLDFYELYEGMVEAAFLEIEPDSYFSDAGLGDRFDSVFKTFLREWAKDESLAMWLLQEEAQDAAQDIADMVRGEDA